VGYRADKAYEEVQAKAFREWKASLTWPEYWSSMWRRWWPFVAGGACGLLGFLTLEYLSR
jgi:hypothetical protein